MRSYVSRGMLFVLCFIGLSFFIGCSYFYGIGKKVPLNDDARKEVSGEFVNLSGGTVHYDITGPEDGQAVVLIHGFTTPYFVWDNNYSQLVKAGFRVLRYDHYGRGYSDRPDVDYDRDLYDRLLFELLQTLRVKLPVHIVGLSMGGAITITFADRHPEMVSKIVLIAPAGFSIDNHRFIQKLAVTPVVGDTIMALFGEGIILSGIEKAFVESEKLPEFNKKFKVQMQYKGYKRALLSTMRKMNMNDLGDTYSRVGSQKKPVQLIWGKKDQVVPFSNSDKVKAAIPHLEFHAIQGGGHNLNYENPEDVNPLLVKFLE